MNHASIVGATCGVATSDAPELPVAAHTPLLQNEVMERGAAMKQSSDFSLLDPTRSRSEKCHLDCFATLSMKHYCKSLIPMNRTDKARTHQSPPFVGLELVQTLCLQVPDPWAFLETENETRNDEAQGSRADSSRTSLTPSPWRMAPFVIARSKVTKKSSDSCLFIVCAARS